MNNPKDFLELQMHYGVLETVGRINELPIARVLAITMNRMKNILKKYEEQVDALVDEYAIVDEKGDRVGVEYDEPGKDGAPSTKKKRDLSKNSYPFEWIEMKKGKREEFEKKLKAMQKKKCDFKYEPIKIDGREVKMIVPRAFKSGETETVSNVEVTVPMIDVLEKKLPVNTLAFLLDTVIEFAG